MAAVAAWYLSGGGANNNPNASLGGAISATQAGASLFDDVTGDESAAGDVEYRGVYVKNDGNVALQNAKVWIVTQTPDTDTIVAIGLSAAGLNSPMQTIANENAAPVGVAFSTPADKASGLSLGNIPVGQYYGIWVRRTVNAGAVAYNNDTFTLRVEGDSGA